MNELINTPIFAVLLVILTYMFGRYLYLKTRFPLFNPLLLAAVLIILFVYLVKIDIAVFKNYFSVVTVFLAPLTVSLAIPIVKNSALIKKHFLPIVIGAIVGATTSVISIILLGKVFALDSEMIQSLFPKSVTTPIAIDISKRIGGIPEITVASVIMSAIVSTIVGPIISKLFKIHGPVSIGMAYGISAHAVGTGKARELNESAGAIGGVAIVAGGIMTVILSLIFF